MLNRLGMEPTAKKCPARKSERGRVSGTTTNFTAFYLEDHLHPQLDFPRIMSGSDGTEVAVREGVADVFKLRVVKGVEGFRT